MLKITKTAQLESSFGMAGTTQLQVVAGPVCLGIMVYLITK